MSFESKTTKEAKAEINAKKKKEKETTTMKSSINWTVVKTVLVTLVTLGALAYSFSLGMNYERDINNRVNSEVKSLTASIQTSKE